MNAIKCLSLCLIFPGILAEIPEVADPKVRAFLETHNRSKPPPNGPTQIRVGIYANSFSPIEKESIYEMTMYLRVAWKDERLTALFTDEEKAARKKIAIEYSAHKYFWRPDLFFRNQREIINRGSITNEALFTVNATGHVWYVTAHVNTFHCPGLSRRYTYDLPTVVCPIMIESYGHTMNTMYFNWLSSPVDVDPSIWIGGFTLADIVLHDCSQNYTAGAFPCSEIRFHLRRDPFNDHVGNVLYISSFLLVIAAWTTFWLDGQRHMMKRLILGLGTTIVLVLELGGAATWYEEWDLMGNKAQFWLAFCALMASISVFEIAVVHVALVNCLNKVKGANPSAPVQVTSEGDEMEKNEGTMARIIDVAFGIILYPATFIIFVFVFFIQHYFNLSGK